MPVKNLNLPEEPIRLLLSMTKDGTYEADVWVDGEYVGGGAVIGGFPAAYELAEEILWNFEAL